VFVPSLGALAAWRLSFPEKCAELDLPVHLRAWKMRIRGGETLARAGETRARIQKALLRDVLEPAYA